jgi:hypothetical protein
MKLGHNAEENQVISFLYYKPMKIVHYDSRVVNKLATSLTDNGRVVIYKCHMFIVQATRCHLTCRSDGLSAFE